MKKVIDRVGQFLKINEVERIQEYDKWTKEIPFLRFPEDWEVQIIPPSTGAIVRFRVKRADRDIVISIYLDCYGRLGSPEKPYWEIYPYKNDVYRCGIYEVEDLIESIDRSLGNKRKILTKY